MVESVDLFSPAHQHSCEWFIQIDILISWLRRYFLINIVTVLVCAWIQKNNRMKMVSIKTLQFGFTVKCTYICFICTIQCFYKLHNLLLKALILSSIYFAISQLSPLGKGRGPSFEQTWYPFTQGCF